MALVRAGQFFRITELYDAMCPVHIQNSWSFKERLLVKTNKTKLYFSMGMTFSLKENPEYFQHVVLCGHLRKSVWDQFYEPHVKKNNSHDWLSLTHIQFDTESACH